MRLILSSAAIAAVLSMTNGAGAQSISAVGGPAEMPPASYQGQQYVDSRGCVFMRAGVAGQTTWVPRIGRDRRAMCGETTPREAAARLNSPAADAPQNVGKPMKTVASNFKASGATGLVAPTFVPGLAQGARVVAAPAPRIVAAPVVVQQAAPVYAQVGGGAACPAEAPVLQRMALNAGGVVTVCTRGDGTATGWVSPRYRTVGGAIAAPRGNAAATSGIYASGGRVAQGQQIATYSADAPQQGYVQAGSGYAGATQFVQTVINGRPVMGVAGRAPQTYVAAWEDGRLNPARGVGSGQGWAQQDQVWTRTVPAEGVADNARRAARKQVLAQAALENAIQPAPQKQQQRQVRVSNSTMSGGGSAYVQVGTFGVAANAQSAVSRLASMGLPVAKARMSRGGQELVAVMAGPFASAADAQAALGMARGAGFGDAFLR